MMSCSSPVTVNVKGRSYNVPCHHCMSCRITYQSYLLFCCKRELFDCYQRGLGASFLTFTYNDDCLPLNGSLDKRSFQNLLKRVRRNKGLPSFKYLACGEYGDKFDRAHYHAVFFGLSDVLAKQFVASHWLNGYVKTEALRSSAGLRYVLDYCCKSINGDLAVELYDNQMKERPFLSHSTRMGFDWLMRNMDDIVANGFYYREAGKMLPLPKYFRDIYDIYKTFDVSRVLRSLDSHAKRMGFPDIYSYSDYATPLKEKELISKSRLAGRPVDDSNFVSSFYVPRVGTNNLAKSLLER
ncbi:replication initiation protein [Tortoise microvirus 94]|nr:replication initiation protein [Tortoise microvirus 94]